MSLYSTWSERVIQRMEELKEEVEKLTKDLKNERAHGNHMAHRARDEQRRLRLEFAEKLAQVERKLASARVVLGPRAE